MKHVLEAVKDMNSPFIKEISRNDFKVLSHQIVLATIRKLELFVRVFAKKKPYCDPSKYTCPIKSFLKRESIKNKGHFLINFVHRF